MIGNFWVLPRASLSSAAEAQVSFVKILRILSEIHSNFVQYTPQEIWYNQFMSEKKHIEALVVAGVVIKKDGKYLLLQEKQPKAYGLWNFPAGKVDIGESFEQTAIREAKEESGYDVELTKKIGIFQTIPTHAAKHTYEAKIIGGELNFPPDEILDAKWFTFDEIKQMKDKLREGWVLDAINILESR